MSLAPAAVPAPVLGANLLCMASMLIWAMGFPAVNLLLPAIPPLPLTALRMVLATAILMPLWLALDGAAALRQADWPRGLLVGGTGFGLGAFLLILAQKMSDAVTVSVITAAMPVVGIAFECLFDNRPVTRRLVIGLLFGIVGGVLAYTARLGGLGLGIGVVLVLLSLVAFCWASRETVRGFPHLSAVGRTTITLAGAALATTLAAGIVRMSGGPAVHWAALGPTELSALALYAFGALAISQILWIVGVARLGIGLASMHINAAPFYVMVFMFALGGSWSWLQVAGAAIVALGVIVAQAPGRRNRPA